MRLPQTTTTTATTLLVLATSRGVLAGPRHDCLIPNGVDHADFSDCGDRSSIAHCLSHLQAFENEDLAACYADAGCSPDAAAVEARYTLDRCEDWAANGAGDLRKRYGVMNEPRQNDNSGQDDDDIHTGDVCMVTSTKNTHTCEVETKDGHINTVGCSDTQVESSSCKPGKTCSLADNGDRVCMDLKNDLDVGGIIIAIVFAAAITIGLGALTFLCCKDKRDQKRLEAKAEATELARAATKKQRAAELRQPLMAQQQQQGPPPSRGGPHSTAGADPFHDRNRG